MNMEGPLTDMNENQESFVQQPGEVIRPVVGEGEVEEIMLKKYGLKVTDIKELNSYDDRNYHIHVDTEHCNTGIKEISDLGFIVKIINSNDSKNLPYFDAQHALMSCLTKNNIPAQVPLPNLNGDRYSLEMIHPDKNKKGTPVKHMVELRTFLPGQILQTVPYTPDLMVQNGKLVANISIALRDMENAYYKNVDPTYRLWTLTNVPMLTKYTFCLSDENKALVEDIVSAFKKRVVAKYDKLPKGHIHGDANEQNILVTKNPSGDAYDISGILDYSDSEYSFPVFDLAINICYLSIDSDVVDQLDTPGHILSGYESILMLTEEEWDVLVPCIAGRLAQSLTLGAHANYLEPENTYVLTTAKKGWSFLHRFWAESESSLLSRWKNIMAQ